MPRKRFYFWLLAIPIVLYGGLLSWLAYVGPITTYNVERMIAQHQQKIVVSLTTTPYRIDKIKTTLDSILNQSIKADKIFLNIPYKFKRSNIAYIVPVWLTKYPGITIHRSRDYGPISKLMPTLLQDFPSDTIVITLDDDLIYPRHVVRDLVKFAMQNTNAAISPMNLRFTIDDTYQFENIYAHFKHGSQASLIMGAAGAAYRQSFFDPKFATWFASLPEACQLADDLVISMYLAKTNINIKQTSEQSFNPLLLLLTYKELPYGSEIDSLSYGYGDFKGNNLNYSTCLSLLAKSDNSAYQQAFLVKNLELNSNAKKSLWDKFWSLL